MATSIKFTKSIIDGALPRASRYTLWDSEVRGLALRVAPSGRKTYVCYHRTDNGTQRRPAIGVHGAITLPQARDLAQQMLGRVRAGQDPSQLRKEARAGSTVSDLCDRYVKHHAELHKKPGSVRMDKANIKNHIKPKLGSRKVQSVTHGDIEGLHRGMHELPGAANRVVALLSKMFNLAEKWGMRPQGSNPTAHITRYKERKIHRDLTELEVARLAKVLLEVEEPGASCSENPRAVAAIRLLLFTGCRRNEILHLRWSEVDLERSRLCLEDSKTGEKIVQLNIAATDILRAQKRSGKNPYAFPGKGKDKPLHDINGVWARIRQRARLTDVRLHDLRHTFATFAAGANHSLPTIGKLLGHRSPATTARYAELTNRTAQRAAEDVGSAIVAAMSSKSKRAAVAHGTSP